MKMQEYSSTTISVLVLLPLLAVFAVAGNVLVLGIIARFKKFRTFPNILIANLAFMDLLRALIEAPMYLLWGVLNLAWFTGKTFAIISLFVTRLCFHLNIVSMLVLLVNVSVAIALDLKYFTWKTNEKAMKIVLIEWLLCFGGTILLSWFDSDIDLQDASVFSYRRSFLIKSKMFLIVILSVFILTTIVIGVLVFCLIQRKKRQRKRLNLPRLQGQARLQLDIQASKTVIITVLAFLVCYTPPLLIAFLGPPKADPIKVHFPRHIAFLCTLLSSGINPVILCFRAKRFRRALKQLLQNPFGKSAFQDTEQKKRSKENVTCKNECEAEKDKERNGPAACSSNSYIDEIVNTGKERGRRLRNQIMPFPSPDAHSQINPWLAWVGNHLTDPAEISSGEESPTPREEYTQHEITVEVHPEPSDRSSKQENGENPATPNTSPR